MATFGQLKQGGYDRLGLQGSTPDATTVTLMERIVNESCAEVCLRNLESYFKSPDNQAWWWLEATTPFVYTATNSYTLSGATIASVTDLGHMIRLFDPAGLPIEIVNRDVFEDIYDGDGTTGTPTIAAITGSVQTTTGSKSAMTIKVWPVPVTTTTGSMSYLRNWTDIATGLDGTIPFIPLRLHHEIVDLIEARVNKWQDSELSSLTQQIAQGGLAASADQ